MAPLKALIIGGGVAGPALAHWLSRIGANITLIERSPHIRASGQQVDLRAQGVPMMKKMGIEAAVRAATVHETGTQLIDLNGRTKAFFPAAQDGTGNQSFTSEYEIMRGDLVRILYGLTEQRPNVQHLFNTTIDSFTQDEESDPNGKVHVSFQDGRTEDFDLIVGTDGSGSKTRRMMLVQTLRIHGTRLEVISGTSASHRSQGTQIGGLSATCLGPECLESLRREKTVQTLRAYTCLCAGKTLPSTRHIGLGI
jgi:2-polyprenyl-6-methoxyphenol hydroxylase-like FAD-dependent oxidoreductase